MSCSCRFKGLQKDEPKFHRRIIDYSIPKKYSYSLRHLPVYPSKSVDNISNHFKYFELNCPKYQAINFPWLTTSCYQTTKYATNKSITMLHISNINSSFNKTIIYSQGFSSDLGLICPFLTDMASVLKCNIISYEYTQISPNEQINIEESLITDLERVIDFCIEFLGVPINQIALMSSSTGSIATIGVASNDNYRDISGLILLSPISVGYYLINGNSKTYYDNTMKAINITCNSFIIHGNQDEAIPIGQSKTLSKYLKHSINWYPNNGNHSNVLTLYREKFYSNMKKFLEKLNNCNPNMQSVSNGNVNSSDIDSIRKSTTNSCISSRNKIGNNYLKKDMTSVIEEDSIYEGKYNEGETEYNEMEKEFVM